jgi:hypothetical protein
MERAAMITGMLDDRKQHQNQLRSAMWKSAWLCKAQPVYCTLTRDAERRGLPQCTIPRHLAPKQAVFAVADRTILSTAGIHHRSALPTDFVTALRGLPTCQLTTEIDVFVSDVDSTTSYEAIRIEGLWLSCIYAEQPRGPYGTQNQVGIAHHATSASSTAGGNIAMYLPGSHTVDCRAISGAKKDGGVVLVLSTFQTAAQARSMYACVCTGVREYCASISASAPVLFYAGLAGDYYYADNLGEDAQRIYLHVIPHGLVSNLYGLSQTSVQLKSSGRDDAKLAEYLECSTQLRMLASAVLNARECMLHQMIRPSVRSHDDYYIAIVQYNVCACTTWTRSYSAPHFDPGGAVSPFEYVRELLTSVSPSSEQSHCALALLDTSMTCQPLVTRGHSYGRSTGPYHRAYDAIYGSYPTTTIEICGQAATLVVRLEHCAAWTAGAGRIPQILFRESVATCEVLREPIGLDCLDTSVIPASELVSSVCETFVCIDPHLPQQPSELGLPHLMQRATTVVLGMREDLRSAGAQPLVCHSACHHSPATHSVQCTMDVSFVDPTSKLDLARMVIFIALDGVPPTDDATGDGVGIYSTSKSVDLGMCMSLMHTW